MAKVSLSTTLPVPARTVWDAIGGFLRPRHVASSRRQHRRGEMSPRVGSRVDQRGCPNRAPGPKEHP
jgi:hypothetical protein